jgi:hypothetical protein
MDKAENLKFLIKAKYGSIKKLSEVTGISENTINTHLRDGNWDFNQACKVINALNIPDSMTHFYFFEPMLAKNASEETA